MIQPRKRVTIIQTAHHFLYLPIHYALHANCFGCIPERYELCLASASPKTDRAAYNQLVRGASPGQDHIGFAIADPAELLHDHETHLASPIILAGLITNSSFWAVDRRTHEVRFLRDLASFDKIIAFPEGTTSHGIASRIYREANKKPSIKQVDPGKELTLLTTSSKGTMVLTPDLLGIDKLMVDQSDVYNVDLALGTTPEYNNVLVTALVSRTDVVQDHPELVRGFLTAIQRAMLLVRFTDPKVIKFAMDSHGETEARVTGALRRAGDAQVFPATIEVSRAHWLNAARAAADAAGRPFDTTEHDRAGHIFRSAVEPYHGLTRDTIRSDILPLLQVDCRDNNRQLSGRRRLWHRLGMLAIAGATLFGTALSGWLHRPALAVGLCVCAAGIWLTVQLPMNVWVRAIHAFWLAAALGTGVWWTAAPPETVTMQVVVPLWVGVEATIVLAVAPLTRNRDAG